MIRSIATARKIAPLALASLTLAACDRQPTATSVAPAPASWRLTEAPADARTVAEVKPTAQEGDAVTVRGRIGGRAKPLNADAPVFVMMDPAIPSCADEPGDNCPTPWDYCCEPRASIAANSATVQLVDAEGNPIEADLTAAGFAPLDEVIVVGTVAARPSPEVLTIRATAIHRVGG
jgi:hypothetical protein